MKPTMFFFSITIVTKTNPIYVNHKSTLPQPSILQFGRQGKNKTSLTSPMASTY